jgi:hypothetical protein
MSGDSRAVLPAQGPGGCRVVGGRGPRGRRIVGLQARELIGTYWIVSWVSWVYLGDLLVLHFVAIFLVL